MSTKVWDVVLFVAALLCTVGFARYYVAAVLAQDRSLARLAAAGFVLLSVATAIALLRVFL